MIDYRFEMDNKRAAAYREGALIGEATISPSASVWILDHTFVDDSARGLQVGRHLVDTVAKAARDAGVKVLPLCPYAKRVMEGDAAYQDVLAGK